MHLALSLATLLGLCLLQAPAFAAELSAGIEPSAVWPSLRTLRSQMLNGTVVRMRIFFIPYDIETPMRMTSDVLESGANYKEVIEISSSLRDTLVAAIDGTKLYRTDYEPDMRWGAVFLDKSERRTHSIYLGGRSIIGAGRIGHIDAAPIGLNGALISWFEINFFDLMQLEWRGRGRRL